MTAPCPSCSHPLPASARFCSSCGATVDLLSTPTGTAPRGMGTPARASSDAGRSGHGSGSAARVSTAVASDARFPPGAQVAGRYRIVGLLGRGGMGEVYRADDLTLGQAVALKFLPESLQSDPDRRERFLNEVRMARQVTHPAVCRVHDVGEVEGQLFLSMEYVDGEDLGSLTRRIGRVSQDKAVEIARQLCAGLAAAHEKGVLHRDLKPENVMLDGRGRVRVTDFGLAGLSDAIRGGDVRSGTPAYMAPEQLEGREVTPKSDIYALGLVLYELFTGKKAFSGRTLAELTREHSEGQPASPSSVVEGLDPAIESAVLRCLEKDPADRPSSALAVAAALPGGDPLAAALAAGETPSPEMVAALAAAEGMAPGRALLCLALVAAAMLAVPLLGRGLQIASTVPLPRSPAALEDRARDYARRLGYTAVPVDEARGWGLDMDYMNWARTNEPPLTRWDGIATADPPFVIFWYRSSPRPMASRATSGRVSINQPPSTVSGMTQVQLDTLGRLVMFVAVPPQVEDAAPPAPRVDPRTLFELAELDFAAFKPVPSRWTPDGYADERAAWEGPYTARAFPVRVETAFYRGRPVYFDVVAPWARPQRDEVFKMTRGLLVSARIGLAIVMIVAFVAMFLARRHLQLGRGDRRGAARVAGVALLLGFVSWILEADHVADLGGEVGLILRGFAWRLLIAGFLWTLYIALEPFVRRRWPRSLVSWTRLLGGRWKDPAVGRDLLVGVAGGALVSGCFYVVDSLPRLLGRTPVTPWFWVNLDPLLGLDLTISELLEKVMGSVTVGLALLLLLLLLRTLLRREWLAAVALIVITSIPPLLISDAPWWIVVPAAMLLRAVPILLTLRFGVLATISAFVVMSVLCEMPIAADLTTWAGVTGLAAYATVAALALYGFRTATGGRGFGFSLGD